MSFSNFCLTLFSSSLCYSFSSFFIFYFPRCVSYKTSFITSFSIAFPSLKTANFLSLIFLCLFKLKLLMSVAMLCLSVCPSISFPVYHTHTNTHTTHTHTHFHTESSVSVNTLPSFPYLWKKYVNRPRTCDCACVCVKERWGIEREREREREIEHGGRWSACMLVCEACEKEKKCMCDCVCVREGRS